MYANIVGHSIYQICILCWVLFKPETLPINPPVAFEPFKGSLNWSVFFNVFVMLQLFNELNARRLPTAEKLRTTLSEWNTFQGISTNPNFVVIMVVTFSLQIVMMEYGGEAVNVVRGGITTSQWMFCVGAGAGSLVWQLFINAGVALFAPTQKLTPAVAARIEEEEAVDAAAAAQVPVVPATGGSKSKWDLVRKGVRRDILYSKVLGASVRRGHELNTLIREGTNMNTSQRRSDVYNKMLHGSKQLHHGSSKKQKQP
jgi:Cation transporting ATPase, C-terminus